ncbi:CPBP family intramembrane metalloprotease [Candidatus Saccharibacteria bacterium]|nr:CPBP family intramembrane metalloprotease [Candidatus Saccharibacteria bacterium]
MTIKKAPTKTPTKRIVLLVLVAIVWTVASIIASQLLIGYLLILILGSEALSQPLWTAIYSALSYILALILIIIVPPLVFKKHPELKSDRISLGLRGLPTWSDIGLAPVGFIVYLMLASVITWFFTLFPWFNPEQAQNVGFSTYMTSVDRIIAFFTLVIIAPIAEEVIFRGWLYGRLRARFSKKVSDTTSMILSMLLVSLVFGLVHFQWNVGVNVFAMSIVLCGLREITGTIYSGIILHILKNGLAFYLIYVIGIA